MFCGNCGKELNPGIKFCAGCGTAVENLAEQAEQIELAIPVESVTQTEPTIHNEPEKQTSKSKLSLIAVVLAIFVVIAFVILISVGAWFFLSSDISLGIS